MSGLYSSVPFLVTSLLLSSAVQTALQLGNALRTKDPEDQEHAAKQNATSEMAIHVFEDSRRDPNQWKIFSMWSCNSPAAKSAYQSSPYSKTKASGGTMASSGIIVFGGRLLPRGHDPYYGTWYYDMKENLWESVKTSNVPQDRKGHFMVTLCHTTVVMMGGRVGGLSSSRLVNDVWIISDRLGTWKEIMKDCDESSCLRSRPTLSADFTARIIVQPSSDCQCKESVLVFVNASVVWELRCLKDEENYVWLRFHTNARNKRGFDFRGQLTASDVLKGLVYAVTDNGVWYYFHKTADWSPLVPENDKGSSGSNGSSTPYPSTQDLRLIEHSLFLEDERQIVLFGRALSRILIFSPANQTWKTEAVVGTPPYSSSSGYFASVIQTTTILAYAGTDGGCKQRVWTLRRSFDAGTWCWSQIPTSAVEPQNIVSRTVITLLGSRLYMRGFHPRPNPHHKAQIWKLDMNSMQWWQLRAKEPPLLFGGWMTTTADQSAIILAGETNHTYFGTWMFFPSSGKWIEVDTPTDLKYKQMHSFVRCNDTDFILFGGLNRVPGRRVVANDAWRFRLNRSYPRASRWHLVVPNKQDIPKSSRNDRLEPTPRYLHTALVINSSMVVFGGQSESRHCLHDVWALNYSTYTWNLVTNNSYGPRPTKPNDCFASAVAVGPHLLVTTGCSPSFIQSHSVECDTANVMQTWLYLPHLAKWSFVAWIRDINAKFQPVMLLFRDYVVLPANEGRFKLHYLSPQCPNGLFSPDMKTFPCQPCPVGEFAAQSRDRCEKCPDGLTTPKRGSSTIFNCSVCIQDNCLYGDCHIYQVDGRPSPVCQCKPGFTGTSCSLPTYYLIALSVLIAIVLIICGTCAFLRLKKRKKHRETELRRQVRELTSAWQVGYSELTIHNRIGAGGFGEVHRAEYRELIVAVKFLRPLSDQVASQEFKREIQFMQTIRHPNIVLFIGAGKADDPDQLPFLITEYVQRGSLRGILDQLDIELSCTQRIKFAVDVACGMHFLHTQEPARIHRDLKSDNLLVSTNWVVKVADFGLGQQLTRLPSPRMVRRQTSQLPLLLGDQMQMVERGIGAARWRCPELVVGSTYYGTAVDVYRYWSHSHFTFCMYTACIVQLVYCCFLTQ